MAAISEADLPGLLAELKSGNLSSEAITGYLTHMNITAMAAPQLGVFLSAMSESQIASILKTIVTHDDTNAGAEMVRTLWVLICFSTVVLSARLFVKWRTSRRLFYDDICMLCALLFGYLHVIFCTMAFHTGLGRHLVFLPAPDRQETLHIGFISISFGIMSPMFGRLGFLWGLLFISGIDPTVKKWTIYSFMALQVSINMGALLVLYAQCGNHLHIIWSETIWTDYPKYCWKPSVQSDYGYFYGSFNTMTDLFLAAVPAIMITHSSAPLKQKITLAFLLCLSILAMIASIVKTYESKALAEVADYTFDLIPYAIWVSIELNVVMIVGSVPFIRPLFNSIKNKVSGTMAKHGSATEKLEDISLGSIMSKNRTRTTQIPTSSSQEHIAPQQDPFTITHTVEVSVTSDPQRDVSLVHAALVGLVDDHSKDAAIWH